MPLAPKILDSLRKHTASPDEAARLWDRVRRLHALSPDIPDATTDPVELACWALHLPERKGRRLTLRERSAQAAEMLVDLELPELPESLVEQATAILRQLPLPNPASDEARVLADAVNLDDFGVAGLILAGASGPAHLLEAFRKQEEYGYWDARLKTQFHFAPVRDLARKRLAGARKIIRMLEDELKEDRP